MFAERYRENIGGGLNDEINKTINYLASLAA
jgi:hypothetical protein